MEGFSLEIKLLEQAKHKPENVPLIKERLDLFKDQNLATKEHYVKHYGAKDIMNMSVIDDLKNTVFTIQDENELLVIEDTGLKEQIKNGKINPELEEKLQIRRSELLTQNEKEKMQHFLKKHYEVNKNNKHREILCSADNHLLNSHNGSRNRLDALNMARPEADMGNTKIKVNKDVQTVRFTTPLGVGTVLTTFPAKTYS